MASFTLSNAAIQFAQIESIRKVFSADFESNYHGDNDLKEVAGVVAEIVKIWQEKALGADPTTLALSFGPGISVTLRQALFLVPQKYQHKIVLQGGEQGSGNSWIDESVMNLLIYLASDSTAPDVHFARSLADDSSYNLDELSKVDGSTSRLEYLCGEMAQGSADWNVNGFYTVPVNFRRLVFFWNYWENHWTTISIDVLRTKWQYQMYNSLPATQHVTKASMEAMGLHLGNLIRSASDIPRPPENPTIVEHHCQQQLNGYDCGVYAVVNALGLLSYTQPPQINADQQRLEFLVRIWTALESGNGVTMNTTPAEKYYKAVLRHKLEDGSMYHKILVMLFDRLLKGAGLILESDVTMKKKMMTCINTGLRQGADDEKLVQELEKIPYPSLERV